MIKDLVSLVILSVCILVIDIIAISSIFRKVWEYNVMNVQGMHLQVRNYLYPIITYVFIILGVYFFVFPRISQENWAIDCILWGFLWGIIVYGIFDFTNLSIFTNYNLITATIDVLWGGILISVSTFITCSVVKYINV